jgi:hypothetical protein
VRLRRKSITDAPGGRYSLFVGRVADTRARYLSLYETHFEANAVVTACIYGNYWRSLTPADHSGPGILFITQERMVFFQPFDHFNPSDPHREHDYLYESCLFQDIEAFEQLDRNGTLLEAFEIWVSPEATNLYHKERHLQSWGAGQPTARVFKALGEWDDAPGAAVTAVSGFVASLTRLRGPAALNPNSSMWQNWLRT